MKKSGLLALLIRFGRNLVLPALTQAGTTVIVVCTEGSGDILETGNSQENLNGAMVWDGSKWLVNNTWAHSFFVDAGVTLPAGETRCVYEPARLKHYDNPQVFQGTSPTGSLDPFLNYTISRNIYTYREPAKAGNHLLRL